LLVGNFASLIPLEIMIDCRGCDDLSESEDVWVSVCEDVCGCECECIEISGGDEFVGRCLGDSSEVCANSWYASGFDRGEYYKSAKRIQNRIPNHFPLYDDKS
jgi:hypothetical protein